MAAIVLQRSRFNRSRAIRSPSLVQLFSSSSSSSSSTSDPNNVQDQNTTHSSSSSPSQSQSSFSSYFSDVKASLKHQQQRQQPLRKPFSTPLPTEKPLSKVSSLEEIRKNLSEFRRRSSVPPPPGYTSSPTPPSSQQQQQHISFSELYKRKVIPKGEESTSNELAKGGKVSFESIRNSIKQMQSNNQTDGGAGGNRAMSLSRFTESFKLRPVQPNQRGSPVVIGGGKENLPLSVFGKEMMSNKAAEMSSNVNTGELYMRNYSYQELGSKLRRLRPEEAKQGDKWFSLGELNDRLMKLNELDKKESESRNLVGVPYKDLRESLQKLQICDEEKAKKSVIQRLDELSQIGGTPNFMLAPPKENLVEKYFHPDNMSSSEKMKLELKKVRDEFKISESDCGSSRVQVAQLTTKIKHLSSALHKKDKHSRKGLQAMVQKRKKLLKYMRRTDWDSYCLVLSKLGLRDNPDYKN